ncbi:MAG: HAMP domain-containing sensor histidine kinase [Synechococcales bacterium]|nr:HAMP domain-containing sensor histidine kinase [Synechococcales bacterium]
MPKLSTPKDADRPLPAVSPNPSFFSLGNAKFYWQHLLGAARTRILLWYVAILCLILIVGIPAFRQFLHAEVDQRVRQDMIEKVDIFRALLAGELVDEDIDDSAVDESWLERKDSRLKKPYTLQELSEFFDAYLSRQLPEDEVYLIAFINGELYKSSPRARPQVLKKGSPVMQRWAKSTEPHQGNEPTSDPEIGDLLYFIEPIKVDDRVLGVFIVAHTTAGERREVVEALTVVIRVIGGLLVVSLIPAWIASGQVLAPLRSLVDTARSVSESDLTQRIPVQGQGEMAEMATTFNDMLDRLQSAFTSQRHFINDAGHELRTPVTIIRGHLELMGEDPQEQAETIALVMDELDRMARMVDDLVLLAKSERPDFLQWENVDLPTFLSELFAKMQALGDRTWELYPTAQGQALIDRQRVTQAVMNLAQNATQHTQLGDLIVLGAKISQNNLHLWVQDKGEGIAPADQTRIFERFARAAKSRRRSEGSGLGLAIVKAIADAHNGRVTLQSQIGFGSTFILILPLQPAHEVFPHAQHPNR